MNRRLATFVLSLAILLPGIPGQQFATTTAATAATATKSGTSATAATGLDPVSHAPAADPKPGAIGDPRPLPTGGAKWVAAAPYFDADDRDLVIASNIQRHELYYTIGNSTRIDVPGWRMLPGRSFYGRPALERIRTAESDQILVAAVTHTGGVVTTSFRPEETPTAWTSVPNNGGIVFHDEAGPAIVSTPDGDVVMLAVSADFGIYQQRWHAGAWDEGWSLWAPAGTTGAALAAVHYGGKVKVFANLPEPNGTGSIKHADLGAPPVWKYVTTAAPQGVLTTDEPPTAALSAPGVVTVAAKGISESTAESIQYSNLSSPTGTFSPWRRMVLNSTWRVPMRPAALTSNLGNLHVYAIGLDSTVGVVALQPGLSPTNPDPQFLQGAEGYSGLEFQLVPGSVPGEYASTPNGAPDWPRSGGMRTGHLNPDPWAAADTKGAYGMAVARFGSWSQNLIIARKPDGSLVATIGRDGGGSASQPEEWAPFGFGVIPGLLPTGQPATSPYEPSAVEYGGRVWVAIVAADQRMYFQLFDPETMRWNSNWTEVPGDGLFIAAPTLAVWHGMLQVFGVLPNNRVAWRSSFRPDLRWEYLPPLETTTAVGAAEFENQLYVAAWSTEHKLHYFAIDSFGSGEFGSGWHATQLWSQQVDRPTLTGSWLGLYTVIRNTSGHFFYNVRNAGVFSDLERVPLTDDPVTVSPDTLHPPNVVNHAGNLDIFAIGRQKREIFTETFVVKADRTLTPKVVHERWPLVPQTGSRDFVDGDGQPVPPPPPPGTPPKQPPLPAYDYYNHCLRGANVPDQYIPAIGLNAADGHAAAADFATKEFGPTGWTLTAVPPDFIENGCVDVQTFNICARWTHIPPAPPAQAGYWAEYLTVQEYTPDGAIQQLKGRDWKTYWANHPDPFESAAWATYPNIPPDQFENGLTHDECDDD